MKSHRVSLFVLVAGMSAVISGCGDGTTAESSRSPGAAAEATSASGDSADPARITELRQQIDALERRKSLIEDANAIKRLQRAHGYYVDRHLWDDIADLFAEDGSIEIGLDGVYSGKARIREYLYALGDGKSGLSEGRIDEHMQLMPVVTVAADGMTAKARWRALIVTGELGGNALWGEGPYENEYVKEAGVWKIKTLHWYQSLMVPYEGGWAKNADVNGGKYVSDELPPDAPPSVEYETWPGTYLPPFHFKNPVTGE